MRITIVGLSLVLASISLTAVAAESPVKVVLCKVKSFDSEKASLVCGKRWINAPKARIQADRLKEKSVVGVSLNQAEWKQFMRSKIFNLK